MQPFKHFKATILKIRLRVSALVYLKPRDLIRMLFSKKNLNKIVEQLYNPNQSDEMKACSAAFGIFMGIIPVWGLQTLVAIFLAMALKLNKTLVVIFSQVSFPLLFPFIVLLSYKSGRYWMGDHITETAFNIKEPLKNGTEHLEQYIYGSISLAIVAAVITGLLTFTLLKLIRMVKPMQEVKRG